MTLDLAETVKSQNDSPWTAACAYHGLVPGRGVGVLMPDGSQVALFRLHDGSLYAVGNIDPFSGAAVMSRGIVGDRAGRPCVQSPIKKQAFAFDDGSCLDDPDVRLPVYRVRVWAGLVEIRQLGLDEFAA
ncbi:MAG: nitrite reductase small subunit NirD [Mycobacterium sp.]